MDKEGVSACQWHTAYLAGAQVPARRISDGAVGGGGVAALPRGGSQAPPDPCLTLCVV